MEQAFLDSVFFVLAERENKETHEAEQYVGGTGFKVAFPARPGYSYQYLVTARHVIEEAGPGRIWIRFNRKTEGYFDLETQSDQWVCSSHDDVAAIRMDIPTALRENLITTGVHLSSFVDADYRYRTDDLVGGALLDRTSLTEITDGIPVFVGADLFIVGLFTQHFGKERNIPIARFGTISALPTEPVRMRRFGGGAFAALAYLIECMSWGGISGSPVFFTAPMLDVIRLEGGLVSVPAHKIGLLGLVSGHFPISANAKLTTGEALPDGIGTITTELNSGIAVVTPASAIKELLMSEIFVEERAELEAVARAREPEPAIPDSAVQSGQDTAVGDSGFAREDFIRNLTKVTRPVEQSGQESS